MKPADIAKCIAGCGQCDPESLMEVFRRMILLRLHRADRLSEHFMRNLMSWVHPGFSVYAGPPMNADETDRDFRLRYRECFLSRFERLLS